MLKGAGPTLVIGPLVILPQLPGMRSVGGTSGVQKAWTIEQNSAAARERRPTNSIQGRHAAKIDAAHLLIQYKAMNLPDSYRAGTRPPRAQCAARQVHTAAPPQRAAHSANMSTCQRCPAVHAAEARATAWLHSRSWRHNRLRVNDLSTPRTIAQHGIRGASVQCKHLRSTTRAPGYMKRHLDAATRRPQLEVATCFLCFCWACVMCGDTSPCKHPC
jgi:hypothetical protein